MLIVYLSWFKKSYMAKSKRHSICKSAVVELLDGETSLGVGGTKASASRISRPVDTEFGSVFDVLDRGPGRYSNKSIASDLFQPLPGSSHSPPGKREAQLSVEGLPYAVTPFASTSLKSMRLISCSKSNWQARRRAPLFWNLSIKLTNICK